MAGVVLETLSNRKLIAFTVVAFLCQFVCFLLGGLIAPAPYNVQSLLATKCVITTDYKPPRELERLSKSRWFFPRGGNESCIKVNSFTDSIIQENKITANGIVFSIQFPLPKDSMDLEMSRWFQNIISVLHLDIKGTSPKEDIVLTIHARLGYRNKEDPPGEWHELANSMEERHLKCRMTEMKHEDVHQNADSDGRELACDSLPLFELGTSHYDYYLVNLRLPVADNLDINFDLAEVGQLEDMWVFAIHQNGGFTMVWMCLKTVFFPIILAALIWCGLRIRKQQRQPNLLERTLFTLGAALSLLNLPLEWLSLWFYMPYMMLLGDIRQGLFYSVLLCFWIIFTGEHMMDSIERNKLVLYWRHLSGVIFACICLFVFEMCERGVQLTNPFYSIWSTPTSSRMAYAFIVLAAVAACLYFVFLMYMIVKVFLNIRAKKSSLPQLSKARRKFYLGLIFRFRFLMGTTLVCAAATVVFFIVGQFSENHWKWDEDASIEYSSAFMTGVYGMWNIYVFALLMLYTPSQKDMESASETVPLEDTGEEVVEFSNIPSEASALASFARKATVD